MMPTRDIHRCGMVVIFPRLAREMAGGRSIGSDGGVGGG